ncbi:hypothetical protein H0H12_29695 (plasmid) [Pseudomonas putida]|uniref:Uncharacterized protein n=1 Tax=Pseudomonas putida TaxID=303 RepID=A0A7D6A532_PSEPU|nr:hypothetical protein [Pseudomonas putida]EKT4531941.1 hypothetical protein [Pseudomonas putida]QLJ17459.1 hypothetical protein H0H12_29695 [Pseudomonas putida]
MGMPVHQFDNVGTTYQATEYNEVWTVKDEEEYKREFCEWLDTLQVDDDGIPF